MRPFDERLDPQIRASIERRGPYGGSENWEMDPRLTTEDFMVPVPDAPDVRVKIYHIAERDDSPAPVIYLIHGGGFTGGTIDDSQDYFDKIILATGAVVISLDYRLAPDHPFPAGFNDCYAVLEWIAASADLLRIDPQRLAVAGGSAGGALAAAVALKARDENGPDICHQVLIIPCTDDRMDTPSSTEINDERVFNTNGKLYAWNAYLGENRENVSPYAAPARAEDLSGLPPAYVLVDELDPLRDEGIEYAMRLMQHGVTTELHVIPGTYHGGSLLEPHTDVNKRVLAEAIAFYKRIFDV